jgi:hypothetical protein
MTNYLRTFGFMLAFFAIGAPAAFAQLPAPDLSRLNPPAARAGETLNVSLYGSNLEELTELRFTHAGVSTERVTQKPDEYFPKPRPVGSSFTVTVAEDVPPGIYEARTVSYLGISTARAFVVAPAGSNEVAEEGDHSTRENAMPVEINSIIKGDVPSRGIDWFRFSAKANQRVLLEVQAERIDSRMDGLLIVYDSDGREVSRNREVYGRDPFLEVGTEQDTEYFLAVSDILYRGGAEHFYRLSISDRPHIDFIFPPAGEAGSTGGYTLFGRNLPRSSLSESISNDGKQLESLQVEITLPKDASSPKEFHPGEPRQGLLPGFDYRINNSNAVRIGFATAPVVPENPTLTMQQVNVPVELAARFDEANDEDVYRFVAKNGKTYCVETVADRMMSRVDTYLVLHKVTHADDGTQTLTQVAENDDMTSFFQVDGKGSINPDTTDSAIVFTSDHDGEYQVTVVNQFGNGSPASMYRLAIREPVPDFELLATFERPLPSNRTGYSQTPTLRRGATAGLRIVAPRQDGFEGDIVITAQDLPPGVTATPLVLSGKTDRGILVLAAAADAESWSGDIRIEGRAKVGERELVREARFAALVWGHIFADSIRVRSRLTERVPLAVIGQEQASVKLQPADDKELTVEIGQKLELPVKVVDNGTRVGTLTVEPHGLFGMHRGFPTVNIAQDASEGTLSINFTKNGNFDVQPGRYQFVLHGTGVTKYSRNTAAVARAEAEVGRITALIKSLKAVATKEQANADAARASVEKSRKEAAAATGDSKSDLEARVKTEQARLDAAAKTAQAAAEKVTKAESAGATIESAFQLAKKSAAEKNTSFAVWSDQITVNVIPAKK